MVDIKFGALSGTKKRCIGIPNIKFHDEMKPNLLNLTILRDNTLNLGDTINFYNSSDINIYTGKIQKIDDNYTISELQISDLSIDFYQIKISTVIEGVSPESAIETLITDNTDLTFTTSVVTGITLSQLIFKNEYLIDIINNLLALFNGTISTDKDGLVTLYKKSETISTKILTNTNAKLQGKWETDNELRAEKVVVLGDTIKQRTTETLSGTGTVFYTTYKPNDIQITGLKQTTDNIDGDYVVDIENKKITFDSSKTNPVVSYSYEAQIEVNLGSGKTVELQKSYLQTRSEARDLARRYYEKFKDGAQSSKWSINESSFSSYRPGDLIYVRDNNNDKVGYYSIENVTFKLPNILEIKVGEKEDSLFDWQKESQDRIKQLEKKFQNSDFISQDIYEVEGLKIKITTELTKLESYVDDGDILFASETTLSSDGDLISDDGLDEDFALAYDDSAVPTKNYINYIS